MVEAEIALGAIELAGRGREEIPRRGFLAADIGQRDQLLHFQYRRVEAAGGDRLVGERLGGNDARGGGEATARGGIDAGGGGGGDAAGGRGGGRRAGGLPDAGGLQVAEEKSAIAAVIVRQQNRAAEGPAELVLPELGLGPAGEVGDEVVGVELVVAQELEGRAVEFVGPRLDGDVHGVAGRVAVFGREIAGLHLEFLHGVDGGDVGDAVA